MARGPVGRPVRPVEVVEVLTKALDKSTAIRAKDTVIRDCLFLPKFLRGRPVRVYKSRRFYLVIALDDE